MNHAWEELGWTLIHFCWQAAAVAIAYRLADAAAAKARVETRYLLSLGALLSMLVISLATLGYEIRCQATLPFPSGAPAADSLPFTPVSGAISVAMAKQPAYLHLSALMPWLDLAWVLGVISLSVRSFGGWWWLQRLRKTPFHDASAVLSASFAQVYGRLDITRPVQLRVSEFVRGPLTLGVLRSLILLPASALLALSPEQLEVVLAHELAHVQRADYLWNLIQTAVETIFFFHPAVWWMGRRIRQYRELCCDDMALRSCSDPLVYATALLCMEEQRSRQLNLAMALEGHQSRHALRERVARILGEGFSSASRVHPLPLAVVCAGVALLLPLSQLVAAAKMQSAPSARVETFASPVPALTQDTSPARIDLPLRPLQVTPIAQLKSLEQLTRPIQVKPVPQPAPVAVPAPITLQIPNLSRLEEMARSLPVAQLAAQQALISLSAIRNVIGQDFPEMQDAPASTSSDNHDYIDRMRAAGYDTSIDKYVAMKMQGITPEYARAMAGAGLGKPSVGELIAMKIHGITPDYISKLHAAGVEPGNFGNLIAYRIFNVTPEFIEGMKSAGFASISTKDVLALRVQNVTPQYAKSVKQQFPEATVQDLMKLRIFHIDDAFIASAKRHGLTPLTVDKLVQLRIFGVLDDDQHQTEKK